MAIEQITDSEDGLDVRDKLNTVISAASEIATVTLSAAQIAALDTTPIEAIAAPGANKVILLESAFTQYTYSTAAYNNVNMIVYYGTDSVNSNGFFRLSPTDDKNKLYASFDLEHESMVNTALTLGVDNDPGTTGQGTAVVTLIYKTIDLS